MVHTTDLFANNTTAISSVCWVGVSLILVYCCCCFPLTSRRCFVLQRSKTLKCYMHRTSKAVFAICSVLMPSKKSDSYAKWNFYLLYDACKYLNANERTKPLQRQTVPKKKFSIANGCRVLVEICFVYNLLLPKFRFVYCWALHFLLLLVRSFVCSLLYGTFEGKYSFDDIW